MNTWHDGSPDPAFLPMGDPRTPPPSGVADAAPVATGASPPVAGRSTRRLAALIKRIVAAPAADEARRLACDGLCTLLRCGGVALHLLDDTFADELLPVAPTFHQGQGAFCADAAEEARLRVPVLADHQVIGSLVLDWGARPRRLTPASRVAVEAVAQVLAQRLAHIRLLALATPDATSPDAPPLPADRLPWLASLCEAHDDAVLVLDAAGRVLRINTALCRLFDLEWNDALAGTTGGDMLGSLERALEPLGLPDLRGGQRLADPDCPRRFLQLVPVRRVFERRARAVLAVDGARLGTVITYRDITVEHDAAARHDQFLASVAHSLRTPLTSVSGYAQLMRRALDHADAVPGPDHEAHLRARGQLAALIRQAARMNDLLRDMLDAAQLDVRRLPVRPGWVDLAALVANAANSARANNPRHSISLRGPGALMVRGDKVGLERIVHHLLDNAVNFSPVGGTIDLTLHQERGPDSSDLCVLRVRDTGLGIAVGMEESLFSPVARRDVEEARHLAGIGLGLRISRALAKQHGGTLRALPTREGGATFELCLPVAGADGVAPTQPPATRTSAPSGV